MEKLKLGFDNLKRFDAYCKPDDDCRDKTFVGGTVSILCWGTIIFLSALRIHEFCTTHETVESIFVDTSRGPKLRINIDIIFPRISCGYLSLDAMDSSGEQHLHIDHHVFKRRLDLSGKPLEDPKKEDVGSKKSQTTTLAPSTEAPANKCGSCYGAENPSQNITCCNTCDELREAYRLKQWLLRESDVEQCKSSAVAKEIEKAFTEGCQIYGFMEVNRVEGSFHIAPGQSFSINHVHVHDVQPYSISSFNTSHRIRHLSFGEKIGDLNINPLDGTESIVPPSDAVGSTMFNYYIKIVPTLYVKPDGSTFPSNQFSVTKHEKLMTPSSDGGMAGVFFSYELSALMVKVTNKIKPVSHLVTDVCSIVGGIWIVGMFIDYVFYTSSKLLEKIELGKAN